MRLGVIAGGVLRDVVEQGGDRWLVRFGVVVGQPPLVGVNGLFGLHEGDEAEIALIRLGVVGHAELVRLVGQVEAP